MRARARAFFGSAPIGFLIGEWWHILFFFVYEHGWTRSGKIPFRELNARYNLNNNARDLHTTYNYVTSTAPDKIKTYLSRRWDLLNIQGASIWAIIFGWKIGIWIKNTLGAFYSFEYAIGEKVVEFIQFTRWECNVTWFLRITCIFMIISMGRILNHNFNMVLHYLDKKDNEENVPG